MADESDQGQGGGIPPWTIKAVPLEERNAAIAAAKRDKLPLGPWIALAIRAKIKADRQADRAPVALEQPPVRPSDRPVDFDAVDRMLALAERAAAASGKPMPSDIRGKVNKLVRVGLRQVDGRTASAGPTREPDQSDRGEAAV